MPAYSKGQFRCVNCGHDRLGGPTDPSDESEIDCIKCGAKTTFAQASRWHRASGSGGKYPRCGHTKFIGGTGSAEALYGLDVDDLIQCAKCGCPTTIEQVSQIARGPIPKKVRHNVGKNRRRIDR
jgi:transcription elongation factor Elf1